MNSVTLVRKNLTRNKLRLSLNCFAIFIAFLLFGSLGAIKNAFESGIEVAAADRLMVVNKINFTQTLPIAYVNKIRAVEGVKHATWANWFGGYYQEPANQLMTFAVDPASYFDVYDDLLLSEEALSNWQKDRQGILVGERIALARGWKVGDRIPVSSNIFSQQNGSSTWEFNISGIFKPENPQTDTSYTLIHYKYFMETQVWGGDWIGWVPLSTDDPMINEEVMNAIDNMFANSPAETETSTEAQFGKAFIEQIGDIGFIIMSVVMSAFFTILLIVGNSMWQSIRERTNEIAVLKTIGFTANKVFSMVLAESFLLATIGGLLGLLMAWVLVMGIAPLTQSFLPALVLGKSVFLAGLVFIAILGFVTGIVPAWQAMKLNTIDALNRR
ncbi:ABC transporter permease [Teredinibacter franksiae]|uniref:ABC transporter permease n=1 Tax=Teredinibacter franksiae TaxID=2761453 RepID=UPI001629970D|nr:FtsX-like permease family protein [Teredinibacter franksiae]